jgi:hypothetical protein
MKAGKQGITAHSQHGISTLNGDGIHSLWWSCPLIASGQTTLDSRTSQDLEIAVSQVDLFSQGSTFLAFLTASLLLAFRPWAQTCHTGCLLSFFTLGSLAVWMRIYCSNLQDPKRWTSSTKGSPSSLLLLSPKVRECDFGCVLFSMFLQRNPVFSQGNSGANYAVSIC